MTKLYIWFIGWLFSVGLLNIEIESNALLAVFILWPYLIGKKLAALL